MLRAQPGVACCDSTRACATSTGRQLKTVSRQPEPGRQPSPQRVRDLVPGERGDLARLLRRSPPGASGAGARRWTTVGRTPGSPCRRRRSPPPTSGRRWRRPASRPRTGRRGPAGRRRPDRRPATAPYGRSPPRRAAARASVTVRPASRASLAMQRSCHRLVSFRGRGSDDRRRSGPPSRWCAHSTTFSSWAGLSTRATVLHGQVEAPISSVPDQLDRRGPAPGGASSWRPAHRRRSSSRRRRGTR